MTAIVTKILFLCLVALQLIAAQSNVGSNNLLDIETPTFFNYNSPLRQPESLRSRPYYDFLSTLYRRDATKSNLFRSYQRTRREAVDEDSVPEVAAVVAAVPAPIAAVPITQTKTSIDDDRPKRAIVFRPLFVYKQQVIIVLCIVVLPLVAAQSNNGEAEHMYLNVETPTFLEYASPLKQPDSLHSKPYFDFLSTLYRHDTTKTSLFQPYQRNRRDAVEKSVAEVAAATDAAVAAAADAEPTTIAVDATAESKTLLNDLRTKRAILFRPVFVYKRQQIRKQEIARKRRRRI